MRMESTVEDPPQKASCPFSECLFQVPANRIGYSVLSLGQLKILQEDHAWSVGLLANLELAEWPSDPPAAQPTELNFSGTVASVGNGSGVSVTHLTFGSKGNRLRRRSRRAFL